MNTINLKHLTDEESFRIKTLVNSWGMCEETILSRLSNDHEMNCKVLNQCDASASMMWDCYIDTRNTYKESLGLLPYQVWNSFRNDFEKWLEETQSCVCYRDMIKELVLPNERYKDYFKKYQVLNKYINRMIDEHNELCAETLDNKTKSDEDLPF